MNISVVKTAIKIGEFKLRKKNNSKNKIYLKYLKSIDKSILNDESARAYLFVVNGIIKKIGGSEGKGGIKSTMSFYENSQTGSPGRPRFIIHLLIEKELKNNKKVEVYLIRSSPIKANVNGLFGLKEVTTTVTYKAIENACLEDYYSIEHKYPDWNLQENHEPYPIDLENKFNTYQSQRNVKRRQVKP